MRKDLTNRSSTRRQAGERELEVLLSKEAPTKQDVAQAKMRAKGKHENRLWAMEERRQQAHPTPKETAEQESAAAEIAEAMKRRNSP